jgi:hypothetical protein
MVDWQNAAVFGQTETYQMGQAQRPSALIAGRSLETAEGVLGSVEVRTLWFQPDHEALSAPKLYGRNPVEEPGSRRRVFLWAPPYLAE